MTVVLHIGTYDVAGGAARAAWRLHRGLEGIGVESWIVAGVHESNEPRATSLVEQTQERMSGPRAAAERLAPKLGRFVGDVRLPLASARRFADTDLFRRADVINLHNLHGNFFDYRVLSRWAQEKAIVWTLHDMWAMTGHVPYSYDCERWRTGCGSCPLREGDARALVDIPQPWMDTTARAWRAKRDTYSRTPMTVVAPSRWLAGLARESILMSHPQSEVHNVGYGLDTGVYRPLDRAEARSILQIPPSAKVVLFSAASIAQPRKGLAPLVAALDSISGRHGELLGLSIGRARGAGDTSFPMRSLGDTQDEHLQSVAYSAADVVAVPSLADNQPLVMLEAMACGVPVVGSDVGGIPEVVRDEETGVIVPPGDVEALAQALDRLLSDADLRAAMGARARETIEREHTLEGAARSYVELYEGALA